MRDLIERLTTVETRLLRCLADGWRNSDADRDRLLTDADVIMSLGMEEYAGRLRAVAAASSPAEALDSLSLALAVSRMLRARLSSLDGAAQDWTPWVVPRKARSAERETIWPLCRFSLGDLEVWSCLRSRGYPVEWILIEAPSDDSVTPWYGVPMTGHLYWQGRLPVGQEQEVQIASFVPARGNSSTSPGPDVYQAIRKRLAAGKLREDTLPAWGGGSIRLRPLDQHDLDGCFWPDPVVRDHVSPLIGEQCWTLVWESSVDVWVPIGALIERGRLIKKLHVVHLVPECPSLELSDLG